ncbi:MAG: trigger factor [Patescibacteria group bacterium]|nr:trigger factor [Patescibacteria group bacterium]
MNINVKKLPKSVVEIEIEVTPEEAQPHLERAATHLSEHKPLAGFRAGHVPFDVAKQRYGEMALLEEALPDIVRKTYVQAVKDNGLKPFGEPSIDVTKLAPGNPIAYKATITVVPAIIRLADWKKIKIKMKPKPVTDKDVEKALEELQRMRTTEAAVDREARDKDKIVVDMDMSLDGVPLEGGQARDHGIYLDEEYYVPGLKEQVLGLKVNESKSFQLKFPADHFQKNIAGKDVNFAVTLKQVFELSHPTLDDEFAKSLGQKSLDDLKAILRKNMEEEEETKVRRDCENEAIDKIANDSRFEDIPDAIVNREIERMMHELEHDLEHRGLKLEDYVAGLKKTIGDLKLEMTPQALRRVRAALVVNAIGDAEKIEVLETDVLAEQTRLLNAYASDGAAQERLRAPEYLDYLETALRNNKIVDVIRTTCVE